MRFACGYSGPSTTLRAELIVSPTTGLACVVNFSQAFPTPASQNRARWGPRLRPGFNDFAPAGLVESTPSGAARTGGGCARIQLVHPRGAEELDALEKVVPRKCLTGIRVCAFFENFGDLNVPHKALRLLVTQFRVGQVLDRNFVLQAILRGRVCCVLKHRGAVSVVPVLSSLGGPAGQFELNAILIGAGRGEGYIVVLYALKDLLVINTEMRGGLIGVGAMGKVDSNVFGDPVSFRNLHGVNHDQPDEPPAGAKWPKETSRDEWKVISFWSHVRILL